MGRKVRKSQPDKVEKLLEDHADVFADIINAFIYHGEDVVKPEDLKDGPTASMYKAAEGNFRQKERDVVKIDERRGVVYALYGVENQTAVNYVMPVRNMGYDYASYEKAVRDLKAENDVNGVKVPFAEEIRPDQKLYPVVTVVLYFGTKRWDGPQTLHEMLNLPKELEPFVSDYKINLIEVAFLDEKERARLKSDFRIVAEYFCALAVGKEKEVMYNYRKQWKHVEELMEFFKTFTNDHRFEKYKQFMVEASKKGEVMMCTLLDEFEKDGIKKGMAEGTAYGRYQSLNMLMKNQNISEASAMEALGFSEEEKTGYKVWLANTNQ